MGRSQRPERGAEIGAPTLTRRSFVRGSGAALVLGGAIAGAFLALRLEMEGGGAWGIGTVVAVGVSAASLGLGARWLLARLELSPARLLRAG